MRSLFAWADALESSIWLRESLNAYPILLTAHVVSMCLFAGLIAFWDLRLVGYALDKVSVTEIPKRVFPWALTGFAVSMITGSLLLYSKPLTYYANFYFWLKMGMLALAGINMVYFHFSTYKAVSAWENDQTPPKAARWAGVASLLLWAGIVVTGRMMAYGGLVPDWWKALNLDGY